MRHAPALFVVVFRKVSLFLQPFEVVLTERLVQHDSNAVRQVQTSYILPHRDSYRAVVIVVQKFFGKTFRFLSEKDVCVVLEIHLVIAVFRLCRREIILAGIFVEKLPKVLYTCNSQSLQ